MFVFSSFYVLKSFEKCSLENLGHGQGEQHSQCQISTSIQIILEHFSLDITVVEIFTLKIRSLENEG